VLAGIKVNQAHTVKHAAFKKDLTVKIVMLHDTDIRIGGAEIYLKNLADLLRATGHQVYTFRLSTCNSNKDDHTYIFKAVDNNKYIRYIRYNLIYLRLFLTLRRYLKRVRPAVVHIHNNYKYPLTILCGCAGYPIVQTVHDYGAVCPTSWAVTKDDLKICSNTLSYKCVRHGCISIMTYLFDYLSVPKKSFYIKKRIGAFISPNKDLKRRLQQLGYHNVYHLCYFVKSSEKNGKSLTPKKNIVLYIGTISEHKGLQYLLKAFKYVEEAISNTKLLIIGKGPRGTKMKALAARLGLQNVHFVGAVKPDAAEAYYKKAVCLVVPSIWMETSPLVVYSAMAYGVPVIATNSGGLPELVQEEITGYIVPRANSTSLAQKIIDFLKNDRAQSEMSQKCREISDKDYSAQEHLEKILHIYTTVIAK
jgi:glycosyltransferase involved in cell wall biosynthesis